MSEVLNAQVTSSEKGGLSRRRVVKGVAWSVPVIVTAIAAPAAAASGINATVAFGPSAATTYGKIGGGGTKYTGTAPSSFSITNTGAAISGSLTGTISIAPVGTVLVGIGVESMAPATLTSNSFAAHASTATFTHTVAIASGQTLTLPFQFHYETVNPKPSNVTYSFAMTLTVKLPDGTSRVLTASPTITF